MKKIYQDQLGNEYSDSELEFLQEGEYIPDYWTRLEHQAAIGAMQGLMSLSEWPEETTDVDVIETAIKYAHALVAKMKEERK